MKTHMRAQMRTHMQTHMKAHMRIHMRTHMRTHMRIHMRNNMRAHMWTHMNCFLKSLNGHFGILRSALPLQVREGGKVTGARKGPLAFWTHFSQKSGSQKKPPK